MSPGHVTRRGDTVFCLDSVSQPSSRPGLYLYLYWSQNIGRRLPTVIQTSIVYTWVVAISTKYFKLWKMCFYSVCQTCPASQVNLESGFLLRMPPSPPPALSFSWSCDSKYSDQLSDVPLSIILFMSTLFPLLVDLCCQKAYTCKNKLRYFIFPVIFRWCVVLILDCCCKNISTRYFLFLTLDIFYLTKSSNQIECLFYLFYRLILN